ncbi:MAG: hypothetical protein AUJ97_06130 [Bacteroidetes bacterium CG2_30_32_10]|nr:MAG: hypothetical protein AUJ97_06130 [Bacteroidetes bacterium CG2_30_32_10]
MSISQLEEFVKTNHHLPNVPSSEEITKNGLKIAEMENIMMQKIEEQTLYIIELNKQLMEQNKKISELENKMKTINN